MKFQQQVLEHLRAKFPDATFEPGPDAGKRDFDPEINCSVQWSPENPAINREFERFSKLHQFCSRLESLTRETGVVIIGAGDWPVIRMAESEEMTDRHHYRLETWGQVEWRQDLDS
jgi:hypothetical protein